MASDDATSRMPGVHAAAGVFLSIGGSPPKAAAEIERLRARVDGPEAARHGR